MSRGRNATVSGDPHDVRVLVLLRVFADSHSSAETDYNLRDYKVLQLDENADDLLSKHHLKDTTEDKLIFTACFV